jgi:hypothetical protein
MTDIPSFIWNILSGLPLIPTSKSVAESWLSWGELGLVVFAVVIIFGLIGEYRAEVSAEHRERSWIPPRSGKHWNWKLIFAAVVVLSIVGELVADADIWVTSDILQTISDGEIRDAREKAEAGYDAAKAGADHAIAAETVANSALQENIRLRAKMADRDVGSEARSLIRQRLRGDQQEITVVVTGIREPQVYAASIANALKAAGFKVGLDVWKRDIPPDTGVIFCENRTDDGKIYDVLHAAHVATKPVSVADRPRPDYCDRPGIEAPIEDIIDRLSAGILTPENVGRVIPHGTLAKWHGPRIYVGQKPE